MIDHSGFNKRFEQTRKLAIGGMVISVVVSLGVICFGLWAVVKLLQHFQVI